MWLTPFNMLTQTGCPWKSPGRPFIVPYLTNGKAYRQLKKPTQKKHVVPSSLTFFAIVTLIATRIPRFPTTTISTHLTPRLSGNSTDRSSTRSRNCPSRHLLTQQRAAGSVSLPPRLYLANLIPQILLMHRRSYHPANTRNPPYPIPFALGIPHTPPPHKRPSTHRYYTPQPRRLAQIPARYPSPRR